MSQWHEVAGLRILHVERDGATTANLMFRVGQADELIGQRGITHLLEHLVLFPLGLRDHHSNGQTGVTITNFHATGTPAEVVTFLRDVAASVRDLPGHRLASEKSILRTEAAQRSPWMFGDLSQIRYGPQGEGVASYAELGLDQLTLPQVEWWRDHFLTADNAVLTVVGPALPEGLEVDLPRGEARAIETVASLLPRGRHCFTSGAGGVLFQTVLERSTAATVLTELVSREMYQQLRLEAGYSYTAGCGYEPRDATTAVMSGYADALEEQAAAMMGRLVDLLAELRWGRFEDSAVEEIVQRRLASFDQPDFEVTRASSEAFDVLIGASALTAEQYRANLEAITPDVVRRLAAEVLDDVLVQVPAGTSLDWAGYAEIPAFSEHRVTADWIAASKDNPSALHVASTGLSWVGPQGQEITVEYAQCAACLAWPDGRRTLFGRDGFTLSVEPTLVEHGTEVVAAIDAAVPAQLVVRMAPRPPRCRA
ncbi:MAG: insulinase family protein, partial [Actinomycetales bacterium]